MTVELFGTGDRARMQEAIAVRVQVFVEEQQVPPDEEIDDHDRADERAVHAIVRDDAGSVLGAGRFYERDSACVQIGRMAVYPAARGRGAGHALLFALLEEARRRGYARASLSAQLHAREFYRKAGFRSYGPYFEDGGIAHQEMEREL